MIDKKPNSPNTNSKPNYALRRVLFAGALTLAGVVGAEGIEAYQHSGPYTSMEQALPSGTMVKVAEDVTVDTTNAQSDVHINSRQISTDDSGRFISDPITEFGKGVYKIPYAIVIKGPVLQGQDGTAQPQTEYFFPAKVDGQNIFAFFTVTAAVQAGAVVHNSPVTTGYIKGGEVMIGDAVLKTVFPEIQSSHK